MLVLAFPLSLPTFAPYRGQAATESSARQFGAVKCRSG
jgi:hypothetical protein